MPSPFRILIVDDDPVQLALLQAMMADLPYHAQFSNSATEALQRCEGNAFDVVITDILMPGMDGLEFIRALHRQMPTVKIIAASAGGQLESEFYLQMARDFGAAMMLEKPITKQKLIAALEEVRFL